MSRILTGINELTTAGLGAYLESPDENAEELLSAAMVCISFGVIAATLSMLCTVTQTRKRRLSLKNRPRCTNLHTLNVTIGIRL